MAGTPPSSQGPPVVPTEGRPKILKLQSSWHRRRRSKMLAVSLKHRKGRRGYGRSNTYDWGGGTCSRARPSSHSVPPAGHAWYVPLHCPSTALPSLASVSVPTLETPDPPRTAAGDPPTGECRRVRAGGCPPPPREKGWRMPPPLKRVTETCPPTSPQRNASPASAQHPRPPPPPPPGRPSASMRRCGGGGETGQTGRDCPVTRRPAALRRGGGARGQALPGAAWLQTPFHAPPPPPSATQEGPVRGRGHYKTPPPAQGRSLTKKKTVPEHGFFKNDRV